MNDQFFLLRALELAKINKGFCSPNPSVGCIILNEEKQIIAEGYHRGAGSPHAEIEALKNIQNSKPHTMYVSLEPCCHHGKTPPCTDSIIKNNIKRVVYGFKDPNSKVNGRGDEILKEHKITCDYLPLDEIKTFYKSYTHWQKTKMPFVTAKIAMSLNGKISKITGEPIQITGEVLNQKTHYHRKISDAILTTSETILHDDPQLNARLENQTFAKSIYILDSQLRISPKAKIFQTAKSVTIFYDRKMTPIPNIRCIPVDTNEDGLNLHQIITTIGQDGIHDLWVEAGGKCFAALHKNKLIQKAYIYIAPLWIANGKQAFENFQLDQQKIHWEQAGNDVFLEIHW